MLMAIALVLLVLWLLGVANATTIGGLIHVLLVAAIGIILLRVSQVHRVFDV